MSKITVLLLGMLLIFSCARKKNASDVEVLKKVVKNTLGTKLVLPENLSLYKPFTNYKLDSVQIHNSNFKIYSLINASCGDCVSKINNWNKFYKELDNHKIPLVLIFRSSDDFLLLKNTIVDMNEINSFPYPFFLDNENNLVKLNGFMNESDSFMTVLTDKNGMILLVGNPIISEEIKDLYLKEIQKRTDSLENRTVN